MRPLSTPKSSIRYAEAEERKSHDLDGHLEYFYVLLVMSPLHTSYRCLPVIGDTHIRLTQMDHNNGEHSRFILIVIDAAFSGSTLERHTSSFAAKFAILQKADHTCSHPNLLSSGGRLYESGQEKSSYGLSRCLGC